MSGRSSIAGLLACGAALAFLDPVRPIPQQLIVGMAALALAGVSRRWGPLLALPGAGLVVWETGLPVAPWACWMIAASMVLGGVSLAEIDRHRRGLAALFWAILVSGIAVAVPDTEEAARLVGVALVVGALGWWRPTWVLGGPASFALVGLTGWVVAWGGRGRDGALVGGAALLALAGVELLARGLGADAEAFECRPRWAILAVFGGIALAVSRIAGLRTEVWPAAGLALLICGLAVTFRVRSGSH